MQAGSMRSFKFRIYPSKKQELALSNQLELTKKLYNLLLKEANRKYKKEKKSLTRFDMNKYITIFKAEHAEYQAVHSQALQNVSDRVSKAYSNFFKRIRRKKAGRYVKAGFPRFKRFMKSITYPQSGFELIEDSRRLGLSKLGGIPIRIHRKVTGKIKTLTIKRELSGKWFAIFSCYSSASTNATKLPFCNKSVGIDVGIQKFAAFSNGEIVSNPKFYAEAENKMKRIQRRLSRKEKRSMNRNKARLTLAKLHEKISGQRDDFLHKLSRKIVYEYSFIAAEKLNVSDMMRTNKFNHKNRAHYNSFSKHISDASWNKFIQMLSYKAESAGRKLICVDPRGTSQECNNCHQIVKKELSERVHHCPFCNVTIDRDINAAINILRKAERLELISNDEPNKTTAGPAGSQACAISFKGNATSFHSAETAGRDRADTLSHKDKASTVCEAGTICDAA